jgi:hypothetical protein
MAEAHDPLLAGELAHDVGFDGVHTRDLRQHLHDFLVGPAVERAAEAADGGGDR